MTSSHSSTAEIAGSATGAAYKPLTTTRRSFIKGTMATALVCLLAVNAFSVEETANTSGAVSGVKHYTIRYDGGAPGANAGADQWTTTVPLGTKNVTFQAGGQVFIYNFEAVLTCTHAEKNGQTAGVQQGDLSTSWTFTGTATVIGTCTVVGSATLSSGTAGGNVTKYLSPDTVATPHYTGSNSQEQSQTFGVGMTVKLGAKAVWKKDGVELTYSLDGFSDTYTIDVTLSVIEKP